jgi:hypothetical protein
VEFARATGSLARCCRAAAAAGAALLAAASASGAEEGVPEADTTDLARPGLSVGAGAVYAFEDFDRAFDDSAGAELHVGYRLTPHFGLSFLYQWLEGFDSTGAVQPYETVAPGEDVELDTHELSLGARFYALTGRFQPYALLGISLLIENWEIVDSDYRKPYDIDVGPAGRFGGGIDFYATPHLVLSLEGSYLAPGGDVDGENFGSLVLLLQYRR